MESPSPVLLLNANYEPLNVCDIRRAFRLVYREKAEVIEYNHHEIRSGSMVFRAPRLIPLQDIVKRPRPPPPRPPPVRAAQRPVLALHAIPPRPAQRALADLPVPRRPAPLSVTPA